METQQKLDDSNLEIDYSDFNHPSQLLNLRIQKYKLINYKYLKYL